MEALLRAFDFIRGPAMARLIWPLVARLTRLTQAEIETASLVLGPNAIPYHSVRVGEGRLLRLIFRFNGGRAFTSFRIVNLPASGHHARENVAILVHELVHVYQFDRVGSVYIGQALRAQRAEGYKYGGWQGLNEARSIGKFLRHYNREQQAQIAQDYYDHVIEANLAPDDSVRRAYDPYIDELRRGDL